MCSADSNTNTGGGGRYRHGTSCSLYFLRSGSGGGQRVAWTWRRGDHRACASFPFRHVPAPGSRHDSSFDGSSGWSTGRLDILPAWSREPTNRRSHCTRLFARCCDRRKAGQHSSQQRHGKSVWSWSASRFTEDAVWCKGLDFDSTTRGCREESPKVRGWRRRGGQAATPREP